MRVLLYTTTDCSLCDAFHFELTDLEAELGFVYEKHQLHPGEPLHAELAGQFPVVEISADGETRRLRQVESQSALRRYLRHMAGETVAG